MGFRGLSLDSFYEGWGDEISSSAINPILMETTFYDRISSYFSIASLLSISQGIETLWKRGGKIRLIVGLHDLHSDVVEAHREAGSSDRVGTFEDLKDRLFRNLSRLEDEIYIDRVTTFATMLRDGFIEMKIASHPSGVREAIFHNKRFIFKDQDGDIITGSGGMNETWMGLSRNFDDLTLQRSWIDPGNQLDNHLQSFERLWNAERPDLVVEDIDSEFATEMLNRIPKTHSKKPNAADRKANSLRELISGSGEYFFHSLKTVTLFPHQERVLSEALRELPVRLLYADEVGLGKTLEAGATLSFLSDMLGQDRVLIVCPKGLMHQWRDEMAAHFDEDYWVWNSSTGEFVSSSLEKRLMANKNPFGPNAPSKIIVSAQLLATQRYREIIETGGNFGFDVLVMDEAHAARTTIDAGGRYKKTKLWDVGKVLAASARNCLLLTATPIQMDIVELHGQLRILGLEGEWDNPHTFAESIAALTELKDGAALEVFNLVGRLLATMPVKNHVLEALNSETAQLLLSLQEAQDGFERALMVQSNVGMSRELLMAVHPAHQMVVRNTRASLEKLGYRFPEREFFAPALNTPDNLASFFAKLDHYLRETYGRVERALHPSGKFNSGFAVSTYYQRIASSLPAAKNSLTRRLDSIFDIKEALNSAADFDLELLSNLADPESTDIGEIDHLEQPSGFENLGEKKTRAALSAVNVEEFAIEELLQSLSQVSDAPWELDPKYQRACEILETNRGSVPTLIYSRYTDTLSGFLTYIESIKDSYLYNGLGMYTGKQVWLEYDGARLPASKEDVVRALYEGKVTLLLCSDAASEGLNLQAAGAIINLDVPWNPARLEQRIGRIDRLGQTREKISVHNLWYPNSVEAEIYQRLLSRKETLELAIGRYPQLVADSIRSAVTDRLGRSSEQGVTFELEQFRDLTQEKALAALMTLDGKDTKSRNAREGVFAALRHSDEFGPLAGALELREGSHKSFRLLHPDLDSWWEKASSFAQLSDVLALTGDKRLLRFVVRRSDGFHLLAHEGILSIFEGLIGRKSVELSGTDTEQVFSSETELLSWARSPRNLRLEFESLAPTNFDIVPIG